MSTTTTYLTRRLGTLRTHAENTEHEITRLQKRHADQLAELAEVEAALAAVDALAEPKSEPDEDDAIAAEIDAAFAEPEENPDA